MATGTAPFQRLETADPLSPQFPVQSIGLKAGALLADPPWRFQNWSMSEQAKYDEAWARRNGRSPYGVMNTADIARLPVKDVCAKDCVLFLWATYPKLRDAFEVIDGWGFTYKTVAYTWVKQNPSGNGYHFGLGYWTRGNPEICLLATRGKPKRVDNSVANLIISPRRDHSRKPDEIHDRIERLVGGPYLEMFARQPRDNWTCLGNETSGGDIGDDLRRLAGTL
jgi:N6-adenosine-specific RNA methylase IME4